MQGTNMQNDYAVNLVHLHVCVFKVAVTMSLFSAVTVADEVGRRVVDCGAGGGHRAVVNPLGKVPLTLNCCGSIAWWSYHLRHDGHPSYVHS